MKVVTQGEVPEAGLTQDLKLCQGGGKKGNDQFFDLGYQTMGFKCLGFRGDDLCLCHAYAYAFLNWFFLEVICTTRIGLVA